MTIQAFIDESGGKGQTKIFTIAGWISTTERWASFSEEWSRCLSDKPRIRCFKMREAAGRSGQFQRLSRDDRDDKLRKLARVIRKHVIAAFHCSVDLEGFAETIEPLGRPFSDPYFWPFHITIMAICLDLVERGEKTRCEIVFDEHSIFGPRTTPWYPLVKVLMNQAEEQAVMPDRPCFDTDDESPPLQAADMLAWLVRGSMDHGWPNIEILEKTGEVNTGRDRPGSFGWLVEEELEHVEMSSHCQFLTRDRLEGIVDQMDEYEKAGFQDPMFTPEFDRIYREILQKTRR